MLIPKVGDMVRLKPMVVDRLSSAEFRVAVSDNESYWIYLEHIEEIIPRPLAVGDRVANKYDSDAVAGELLAIHGALGWVLLKGNFITRELTNLVRVDP